MATSTKGKAEGRKDGGRTNPEIQDDVPKDSDEEKDAKSTASTKTGTKKAPIQRILQDDEVADDAEPQGRPQRCIEDLRRTLEGSGDHIEESGSKILRGEERKAALRAP